MSWTSFTLIVCWCLLLSHNQVHAIYERGHQATVGSGIQSCQFWQGHPTVDVHDWLVPELAAGCQRWDSTHLRISQHTPGTYPRPPTNSLWRNSFHLGVWGSLGYAPGVCWGPLRTQESIYLSMCYVSIYLRYKIYICFVLYTHTTLY